MLIFPWEVLCNKDRRAGRRRETESVQGIYLHIECTGLDPTETVM